MLIRGWDFLITPTVSAPAIPAERLIPAHWPLLPCDWIQWAEFSHPLNMSWNPAATVPCGFTKAGLPVGLQIVGRRFDDPGVMQTSRAFERIQPCADKRPKMDWQDGRCASAGCHPDRPAAHPVAHHLRMPAQRPARRHHAVHGVCRCRLCALPEGPGEGYTHLILLYCLNQAGAPEMQFTPPNDTEPRRMFATRTPRRPNPFGLSVAKLGGFAASGVLQMWDLDCVDGTPLLDIRPFLRTTDCEREASMKFQAHRLPKGVSCRGSLFFPKKKAFLSDAALLVISRLPPWRAPAATA